MISWAWRMVALRARACRERWRVPAFACLFAAATLGIALAGCHGSGSVEESKQGEESRQAGEFKRAGESKQAKGPTMQSTSDSGQAGERGSPDSRRRQPSPTKEEARFAQERERMVREQMARRDITDSTVLAAMRAVPRHLFVPENLRGSAYADTPLPIGHDQTISQPYIVALMTQLANPKPDARALDIGTGSGYQAAVLAELVDSVYSMEILCPLADEARERLQRLAYRNVEVRCGDGYRGWPEHAPFDVIIVAAAPEKIPPPLIEQLAPGGRLVIPVGDQRQSLMVVEKRADGTIEERQAAPVRFVPMTGEARK